MFAWLRCAALRRCRVAALPRRCVATALRCCVRVAALPRYCFAALLHCRYGALLRFLCSRCRVSKLSRFVAELSCCLVASLLRCYVAALSRFCASAFALPHGRAAGFLRCRVTASPPYRGCCGVASPHYYIRVAASCRTAALSRCGVAASPPCCVAVLLRYRVAALPRGCVAAWLC